MEEDRERTARARQEIASAGLDLALCQLSQHVLMLTGYAPVLGQSYVLFPVRGEPTLIVPDAEETFARKGWCADVRTYQTGLATRATSALEAVAPVLRTVLSERGWDAALIGYEGSDEMVVASYCQVGFPPSALVELIQREFPRAQLIDLAPVLDLLMATMTSREQRQLCRAVEIASLGFEQARAAVAIGTSEAAVASAAEAAIQAAGRRKGAERVQGFAHVMSGARSALAFQPFNLTNDRVIQPGDPVLVQLEVYADGFWAEAARTYFAGEPGAEGRRIYEACLQAQQKAIQAIHHGVGAAEVDQVARDYLGQSGFAQFFRHGLGHGVGFQAISHFQPPRLRPDSTDTILADMIFNVEPGIYVHGWGGVRINDLVHCRPQGADVLTEMIPRDLNSAIVPQRARA